LTPSKDEFRWWRKIAVMRSLLNLTAIAGLAGVALALPPAATAQTSLCAMLPQAEVTAVVGTPVKLSEGKMDSSPLGGGLGTMRSQICNYDPPGGIGSGPTTVRVTITSTDSASAAVQWFKAQLQFLPSAAGKGEPLAGVGDEAVSFHASASIYMRKKNVIADIHVGRRDLDLDKEVAMGKTLAQKLAARVQ
jgi:hypothetical protein